MVYVVVDEPQGAYYGGVVAAPIASSVFAEIFKLESYLKEETGSSGLMELPTFIGMTLTEAAGEVSKLGLQYLVQGEGDYVTKQIPAPGADVKQGDIVLLMFE